MSPKLAGKTILLVNAGSLRKKFILERIAELGVHIICLDTQIKDFAKPFVRKWILADLLDEKQCIQSISQFLKKNEQIDGIITFWDECTVLTAAIAEKFGWAGMPKAVAKKIKNKYSFRKFCHTHSLPSPLSKKIASLTDVALLPLPYPVVVKPIFGVCSAFVKKVHSPQEIREAIEEMKKNKSNFFRVPLWQDWGIMAEEYVGGQEVDIDVLVQKGSVKYMVLTDNHATREPFFLETGQNMPSWQKSSDQKQLLTLAVRTLKMLGVTSGCIHFEAKMTSNGPIPIEINLRMGGGDVYLFSKRVWGVDLIEQATAIAVGVPTTVSKSRAPLRYLLGEQFLADTSVKIKKIIVSKELRKKKYLEELFFEKKEGDTFLAPPRGFDSNIGWIVVSGKNKASCQKNLAEAKRLVHISTSPLKK